MTRSAAVTVRRPGASRDPAIRTRTWRQTAGVKALADRVAELQAYHLVATVPREGRGPTLTAASDLSLMKGVLRSYLGSSAADVEKACARAEAQGDQNT